MTEEQNYYVLLDIPVDASTDELRRAYREAAKRYHPDRNQSKNETELFLKIQEAYDVLADPDRRAEYDANLPPEMRASPPVNVNLQFSRPCLYRIPEPQLMYALLEISPKEDADPVPTPPLNLCLVIDCSTSMQGAYLDTVKLTAIELVRQLGAQDVLSLVSFNDTAQVVLPGGMRYDPRRMETNIQMLHAEGGTEIFKGLESGYAEVRKTNRAGRMNHVILLTDGRTYGDEEACLKLAAQAQSDGIGISALGIGSKWNDAFLDQLTSLTGGHCMYVNTPKEVAQILKEKVSGLSQSFADQVRYDFELPLGITLNYAFRLHPETSMLTANSPVLLGRVPRRGSLSVLMEFLVAGLASHVETTSLAEGRLSMEMPGRKIPKGSLRLSVDRPAGDQDEPPPPPAGIVQALSHLTLYRMQENVQNDLASGNIKGATQRLQYLATNLLARGEMELARLVVEETKNIQIRAGLTEDGKKKMKYGTRALMSEASFLPE